jgi:hypothetical protein
VGADCAHNRLKAEADWGQKASVAIGFIKATEKLRKKPHITLKKPRNLEKASISLKKSLQK